MSLYLGSEPISAYISGTENGRTAYVHIKYSNDGEHFLYNPTAAQRENAYYIGIRADYQAIASETFSDYSWTRVRHDSTFLHMKFAPNGNPTSGQITSEPQLNTKFIGLYVDTQNNDSTDPTVYNWTRIAYDECYLHIKYSSAPDPSPAMMTSVPTETTCFIGICWDRNQEDPTTGYSWTRIRDSFEIAYSNDQTVLLTDPQDIEDALYMGIKINEEDYIWSRIKNESNSVFIKYATCEDGINYVETQNPSNATFIGTCSTTDTIAPVSLAAYNWTPINFNTHIRYGIQSDNGIDFVTTPESATYIGFLTDNKIADSNNSADYTWTKIRQPLTYFHIKYSQVANPTASQMSDNPTNASYIGIAITDSTIASIDPTKYDWINVIPNLNGYATQNWVQTYHDNTKQDKNDMPTKLTDFTDNLSVGKNPIHTHNQYLTSDNMLAYNSIGTVHLSTQNINPGLSLGGTWTSTITTIADKTIYLWERIQ